MTWKDQQVTAYFGQNAYDYNTVNAAGSYLYEFDVEANANIARGIDLYGSVGHVRTKLTDFVLPEGASSTVELTDTQFPYAPRWPLSSGINTQFGPASSPISTPITVCRSSPASARIRASTRSARGSGSHADHGQLGNRDNSARLRPLAPGLILIHFSKIGLGPLARAQRAYGV
ncbi:hypothetical protein [Sphingobium ummariense]